VATQNSGHADIGTSVFWNLSVREDVKCGTPNDVEQEGKFLANSRQKIIIATCCIHICNRVSTEPDTGHSEPLFNSPNIPYTRRVSHIHVYFPDPDKENP
jgi:hypothetical protein